jgi:hypothetical protein
MQSMLEDAFWKYVQVVDHGCWEWLASLGNHGYGQLTFKQQKYTAHRLSWELHNGPIPDGLCVCHTCDNRSCVNPNHLFLGTRTDNLRDMTDKGRRVKGESHGGVKLTEEIVLSIRSSEQSGVDLAAMYGVSPSTICSIRKRRIWSHV